MRNGWPRNLGELVGSMTGEPEGHRHSKVRAGAGEHPRSHRSETAGLAWYRQAKATKRGEKGNEQS